MIKVENLTTPDTIWWDVAVNGMRNSYKSNERHDSHYCYGALDFASYKSDLCIKCPYHKVNWVNPEDELDYDDECRYIEGEGWATYILGENDLKLLLSLCKAGTSHRKVLRQLPVIMDITAPLYWWKQMDQYKLGTVTNSESTMHTLIDRPFELGDFSFSFLESAKADDYYSDWKNKVYADTLEMAINNINRLREHAVEGNKEAWNMINELLPQSYNQKRTWSANYEVLLNIIQQRRNHRLPEWNDFIECMLDNVPYLKEVAEAANEI